MNAVLPDEQDARDMQRLVNGEEAALNDLMGRHVDKLLHYLFRCLQDEEDAADLAQETFAKVYLFRTRFDPRHRFSSWLYSIASNQVKDRYKWRSRHPQVSLDAVTVPPSGGPPSGVSPEDGSPRSQLVARERADAVRQAIAALPPELRQPLILAEYEDLPHAEIGLILGCSAKAVETRIYRARQILRAALGEYLRDP